MKTLELNTWLKQPGILKKLQIALALSLCTNVFLLIKQIPKVEKEEKAIVVTNSEMKKTLDEEEKVQSLTEFDIKNFIKNYLNYFFSTGLVAQSYIEKHSNYELFQSELEPQLLAREEKNLSSNFHIHDFYIEEINLNEHKVILVGTESFDDNAYEDRQITMIMILDEIEEGLRVQAIPKFEVK